MGTTIPSRTIYPKPLTKSPIAITDIEVVESGLCAGTVTVQAINGSSIYAYYDWEWTANPSGVGRFMPLARTRSSKADLVIPRINSDNSLGIRVKAVSDYGDTDYIRGITMATFMQQPSIARRGSGDY